jgi:hypothetical protein
MKIGANESHLYMLFNNSSKRVHTVKGWFNPELNEFGSGGYGSGALKNRWWKNLKKQTVDSLIVWRDIKSIRKLWVENNSPGYFKFIQIIQEKEYLITRSRVENIVKLFKDANQYEEMLMCHQETNFTDLIEKKLESK